MPLTHPASGKTENASPKKKPLPKELRDLVNDRDRDYLDSQADDKQEKTRVEKIIEYEQKFNLTSYQYPFNIFSEITRSLAERIKTHIDKAIVDKLKVELFQKENPKDEFLQALKFPNLRFVLSTYGGSVFDSFTICNAFEYAKKQGFTVEILATGTIMSAGIPIFSSGSKGFRKVEPGTFFLIHNISSGTIGTIPEIRNQVKFLEELDKVYSNIIIRNTKISKKDLKDILSSNIDYYYTSEEALEQGLADEII